MGSHLTGQDSSPYEHEMIFHNTAVGSHSGVYTGYPGSSEQTLISETAAYKPWAYTTS